MKLNRFQKLILISGMIATTAIVYKMMQDKKSLKKNVGTFIPTNEWQEVLPGQAVPKGLKIRMDFNTHKKYAKLDDGVDDRQNMGVVVSDTPAPIVKEEKEMDEAEKLAKVISDALLNKSEETSNETSDQMKERVLLSLPEPLEELKDYHHLSEEEKKKIIDAVWERRQKDLEEAMKNIRGDAELMIERLDTIKSILPSINQEKNETSIKVLEDSIEDIQWLIMDVDNVEDFLKMKGEAVLFELLTKLQRMEEKELFMATAVTMATVYKNSISLTDYSTCQKVLRILLESLSATLSSPLDKKALYSINIIITNKPALGQFFIKENGVSLLEQFILGSDKDLKRKSLEVYRHLLQMFVDEPRLATSNICSQTLLDLTATENREEYPLVQSYLELLKVARHGNELSCIHELEKSGVFMNYIKERYVTIRDLAREEVKEEGEEGYYTSLVYLIHSVFEKEVEQL